MTKERKIGLGAVATVLGIIVAYLTITASVKADLDDRYVRHAEFQQLRSDVRVIKCAIRPDLCLTTSP